MKRAFSVFYSEPHGELTSVEMSEHFRCSTPLTRSDILLDAIHDLIGLYNKTLKERGYGKKTQSPHALHFGGTNDGR